VPEEKPPTGPGAPPGQGEGLRPTVMKPPAARERAARPATAPPGTAPPVPTALRPTTIPGVRRERLGATPDDLRALSPGASPAACAAAARLLETVAADKMNERKAVLWGHELQKAHGEQVTAMLALAQDPLLELARGHVARMTEILGAIDLMAVCGHDRRGLLGGLARSMNDRIDTPAELAEALAELQQLLDRMSGEIERLVALAERLRQVAAASGRIDGEAEAAALAALFLAQLFAREAPELPQRFTARGMSLTATVAQLRQNDPLQRLQLEQPLQLVGVIQNVALVTLPGFLAGLGALLGLAKSRGASPTEARDMSYQLRDLLHQLKT